MLSPDLVAGLPAGPSLLRVRPAGRVPTLGLWRDGAPRDLGRGLDARLRSLDELLKLPTTTIRALLDDAKLDELPTLKLDRLDILAPCES